jgi:hypothetical protein
MLGEEWEQVARERPFVIRGGALAQLGPLCLEPLRCELVEGRNLSRRLDRLGLVCSPCAALHVRQNVTQLGLGSLPAPTVLGGAEGYVSPLPPRPGECYLTGRQGPGVHARRPRFSLRRPYTVPSCPEELSGALRRQTGPVLTLFSAAAVTFMMLMYALERRGLRLIPAFACGCLLSSAYGFLAGTWPFGVVEAIWAAIAVNRYRAVHAAHPPC